LLVAGDPDTATLNLAAIATQQPGNFRVWSDLSAAYLQRFELESHPLDLVKALDAASRAVVLAPKSPEARFNLALSMGRLHLRGQARIQWGQYLQVDQESGWSDEAQSYLRVLSAEMDTEAWERSLQILEARVSDDEAIESIAEQFRDRVGLFSENELLPAWAKATLSGRRQDAEALINTIGIIGDSLARPSGDRLLHDSVAAVRSAMLASNLDILKALAKGHDAYGRGLRLTESGDDLEALITFRDAVTWLEAGRSPFCERARIAAGYSEFYRGNHASLPDSLKGLPESLAQGGYISAASKARLLLGLAHLRLADLSRSLDFYRGALQDSASIGDREGMAAAHFMIAENLRFHGESEQAWKHRYQALTMASALDQSIYRHNALFDMAEASLKQDLPRAALLFQNDMVKAALRNKDGLLITESFIRRGRTRLRLTDTAGARRDVASAATWSSRLPLDTRRAQLEADIKATAGDIALETLPANAVGPFDEALMFTQSNRFDFRLPSLFYKRALARLARGEIGPAETDLYAGILEAERQRERILEQQLRISYSDDLQKMFDKLIELRAGMREGWEASFLLAERSRTRNLLEAFQGRSAAKGDSRISAGTTTVSELQKSLDPGVLLLEYSVLPDKLLVWVVSRDTFDLVSIEVAIQDLSTKLEELNTCIRKRCDSTRLGYLLRHFYDVLLRSIPDLNQFRTLIVVPDKILSRIPFASLINRSTGRYLIQDFVIGYAPSATLYLKALKQGKQLRGRGTLNLLAIGNPNLDRALFPNFVSLDRAEEEVRRIARAYWKARVLTGNAASKEAFLQEAPEYDIVHVAAHALINNEYPLLSMLLLAASPEKNSGGAVYAHEMYRLRFQRTHVVILSGCETAAGRIYAGEGVASLARPLLAAGVPAVVGNLWKVGDGAAQQFHESFHRGFASGETPLTALQRVQKSCIESKDPAVRHPSFWAGYQLIGGSP
jgi:CHAT domain-containing protein